MKTIFCPIAVLLLAASLESCRPVQVKTLLPPDPAISQPAPTLPDGSSRPISKTAQLTPALPSPMVGHSTPTATADQAVPVYLAEYAFPEAFDPAKRYLFYLHGKIIEDQGIPAVGPEYTEYEYETILEKLHEYGFVVISEQRAKDADGEAYARHVVEQVSSLLEAGVPAKNITVVGASKGAGIAIFISHFLENEDINFVLLSICAPKLVDDSIHDQIVLYGNVLSIYDPSDKLAGSCQELMAYSESKGLLKSNEIVLNVGIGHGFLYRPLEEWIIPTVEWARNQALK